MVFRHRPGTAHQRLPEGPAGRVLGVNTAAVYTASRWGRSWAGSSRSTWLAFIFALGALPAW